MPCTEKEHCECEECVQRRLLDIEHLEHQNQLRKSERDEAEQYQLPEEE